MRYHRIFTDSAGETHFNDIDVSLKEVIYSPPAGSVEVSAFETTKQYAFERMPPS